ncbi:MAG: ribonuclease E inhibitor RraB [Candidatus Cloacimonetes bacterium]|nr:ribonuclease E inhibitor RraB [Candidatus Cloacimonadota bacterium]
MKQPVDFYLNTMGFKVVDIEHGSLFAIPLKDGTWGLGQALYLRYFEHKGKHFIKEMETVLFKHIRVKRIKDIPLDTPLRREDIVFIYTDDGCAFHVCKCKVLPCVREPAIEYSETLQYESRKDNPNASTGTTSGPNHRLNAYFGLEDWWEGYEEPRRNAAIKINPNLRPPNAQLWVRPDPKDRMPVLCFYLYFKTAKGRNEFVKAVASLGYELIEKIPASKDAGVTAGVVLKADLGFDSQDQYEAQLEPIAKEYGGYYDGMEQV